MTDKGFRKDTFEASSDRKGADSDKIRAEVEKLAGRSGMGLSQRDIVELQKKFGNDAVGDILRLHSKRMHRIRKQAREIAAKIARKYSDGSRPLHEILDRMLKYKADNKWTDMEYDIFKKELYAILTNERAVEIAFNPHLVQYRSKINQALGMPYVEEGTLNIKESEHGILNEILSLYEKHQPLHRAIFMQSAIYEDCSLVAMTGEFDRKKHIASNHINPLLAALYLPKISLLEFQTLYSNFGSIIKCRHQSMPVQTEPDAMLYYDICSDPNDIVCNVESPITDIRNRYRVQIDLWETVMKLRSGSYYDAGSTSQFLSNLNQCRNNLYDNADLAYNQDEGAILRRLMSVFSLRPTMITIKQIQSLSAFMNPLSAWSLGFQQPNKFGLAGASLPFNNQPVHTITQIPMITVFLPPHVSDDSEPIDLREAREQTIWINEGKVIVPKEQSIIYSKELLIFYANRRVQRITIKTYANPLPFSQLPLTMNNFERLNKYPIIVPSTINLKHAEEVFELRSVVVANETEIMQSDRKYTNIITGSSALIMKHRDNAMLPYNARHWLYDPFGASLPVPVDDNDPSKGHFTNKPISIIDQVGFPSLGKGKDTSFFGRAQEAGTIFIYAKPNGFNRDEIIAL